MVFPTIVRETSPTIKSPAVFSNKIINKFLPPKKNKKENTLYTLDFQNQGTSAKSSAQIFVDNAKVRRKIDFVQSTFGFVTGKNQFDFRFLGVLGRFQSRASFPLFPQMIRGSGWEFFGHKNPSVNLWWWNWCCCLSCWHQLSLYKQHCWKIKNWQTPKCLKSEVQWFCYPKHPHIQVTFQL